MSRDEMIERRSKENEEKENEKKGFIKSKWREERERGKEERNNSINGFLFHQEARRIPTEKKSENKKKH